MNVFHLQCMVLYILPLVQICTYALQPIHRTEFQNATVRVLQTPSDKCVPKESDCCVGTKCTLQYRLLARWRTEYYGTRKKLTKFRLCEAHLKICHKACARIALTTIARVPNNKCACQLGAQQVKTLGSLAGLCRFNDCRNSLRGCATTEDDGGFPLRVSSRLRFIVRREGVLRSI